MSVRPRPEVGLPLPPPREPGFLAAHGRKLLAAAALAGLLLLTRCPSAAELGRRWGYGAGYVPWVELEWKAKQHAATAKKPLLVYRVDPRHPQADRFLGLLAAEPVRARVDRVVWLRREEPAPAGEPPAAPALLIYGSNTETVLVEREDAHTLEVAELAQRIDEALAANAHLGER